MFKKEQSYRRRIVYGLGVVAMLESVIGVLWILSITHALPETWGAVLGAVLIVIASVATVSTLFGLLVLWPDFKQEARKEMVFSILEYEDVMWLSGPGIEKTRDLVRIASNMRKQAYIADFPEALVRDYLISHDEGERLAGLSIILGQERLGVDHQYVNYLDQVLKLMKEPWSPFEHYHTVEVLKGMKLHLSDLQREKLRDAVRNHIYDPSADSNQWPAFCREILGEGSNESG